MKKIVAVCLSPTLQETITFDRFDKDRVNRSTGYRLDASGKAVNAARVLNQLESGSVTVVAPLGTENSQLFFDLAAQDSLRVVSVPVPGRIRYCYTLVESGKGSGEKSHGSKSVTELVVSEGATAADYSSLADALCSRIAEELSGADALLLAGSCPPFWPDNLLSRICGIAHEKCCPVMVDFQGKDLELAISESCPEIIKINEEEFTATFSLPFPLSDEELERELGLRSITLNNIIIVTRGKNDTLAASSGVLSRESVEAVNALNTIGCGDAFSAGFLMSWLNEQNIQNALTKGKWCATRNTFSLRPGSIID